MLTLACLFHRSSYFHVAFMRAFIYITDTLNSHQTLTCRVLPLIYDRLFSVTCLCSFSLLLPPVWLYITGRSDISLSHKYYLSLWAVINVCFFMFHEGQVLIYVGCLSTIHSLYISPSDF